ncbi:MAG: Transcriptional regulator, partial [Pelotomaculum thermopropionicum]
IREREIDLGIIGAPLEGEGINCVPWIQDHMVLIVPPLHAWVDKKSVGVTDFEDVDLVLREPGSGTRQTLERILGEKNIFLSKMNRIMELGSTRAVITAVESGLGVSIVSRFAVRESLELGRVCEIRINGFNLSRYLYQVSQPHGIGGYANEAFIDFINDIETCKRCLLL